MDATRSYAVYSWAVNRLGCLDVFCAEFFELDKINIDIIETLEKQFDEG
jgi:hypothetical protein